MAECLARALGLARSLYLVLDTAARALSRCARTKQKQSEAARFYLITQQQRSVAPCSRAARASATHHVPLISPTARASLQRRNRGVEHRACGRFFFFFPPSPLVCHFHAVNPFSTRTDIMNSLYVCILLYDNVLIKTAQTFFIKKINK